MRFAVTSSPDADDKLADMLLNSPSLLRADIRDASDRIDRAWERADLLAPYRGMSNPPTLRRWDDYPLAAFYEVDHQNKIVRIVAYSLILRVI